jgi:endonuclease YncB( thermonuclease family)
VARAEVRSFIRGRAIECQVSTGADAIPDPATCLVGGDNISEWLVAQGWAKRNGDAFADAEDNAKKLHLGIWSDRRPADHTVAAAGVAD